MKVLFDIGHPAHVHLFRNFIVYLNNKGVNTTVVTRDKEITNLLLSHYGIPFTTLSAQTVGMGNMLVELFRRDWSIIKLHWQKGFNFAYGTSASIGHLSAISKVRSYNFNEDDDDIVPLYAQIAYPFSTKVVVPDCLEYTKWKNKRVTYNSYHELAYLHPGNFTPNVAVLEKYKLTPGKYIVLRFSSLQAHHDVGVKGISQELWGKIEELVKGFPVVKSVEKSKTHQIEPWDMHHVLAFAGMVVSDSQTMTAEAAVLGVPSARINTFARKIGYLKELEFKYGLTRSFLPNEEEDILNFVSGLVNNGFSKEEYAGKREAMLKDKVDFNQWMIEYFEKEAKQYT